MRFQLTKPFAGLLLVMLVFSNLIVVEAQVSTKQRDEKTTTQTIPKPTATPTPKPSPTPTKSMTTPTPSPSPVKTPVLNKKGDAKPAVQNTKTVIIYRCPPKRIKKARKLKKRAVKKTVVAKKTVKKKSTTKRKASRKKTRRTKPRNQKVVTAVAPAVTKITLSEDQLKQIVDSVVAKLGSNKLSEDDKTTVRQIVAEELGKTNNGDGNNPGNTPPANGDGNQPGDDQTGNGNQQEGWFSSTYNSIVNAVSHPLTWAQANWQLVALGLAAIVLWLLGRKYRWARWLSYVAILALLYFCGFLPWLWNIIFGNWFWFIVATSLFFVVFIAYLFRDDIVQGVRHWRNPETPRVTPAGTNPQEDLYGDIPEADIVIDAEPVLDDDDPDERTR